MTIEENIRYFFDSQRKSLDKDGALTEKSTTKFTAYILITFFIYITVFFVSEMFFPESDQNIRHEREAIISYSFLFIGAFLMTVAAEPFSLFEYLKDATRSKISLHSDRVIYQWRPFTKKKEIFYSNISRIKVKTKNGLIDTKHKTTIISKDGKTISFDTKEFPNRDIFKFFRSIFRTKVIDSYELELSNGNTDLNGILYISALLLKKDVWTTADYNNARKVVVDYILTNYCMGDERYRNRIENRFDKALAPKNFLDSALAPNKGNYKLLSTQFNKNGEMRYEEKLSMFDLFFSLAYMSNGVNRAELDLLYGIAHYLLIQEWDLINLEYKYECRKQQTKGQAEASPASDLILNKAYEVLGLKSDATIDDVKRGYRQLAKTCHPDTLPTECSDVERENAVARFRVITEAYDVLLGKI